MEYESPEEFAAELKRLYDKARPTRNTRTRREDLVSHFLAGLNDDQARIYVELNKDPQTLDEAVLHVVHYNEVVYYKVTATRNDGNTTNHGFSRIRKVQVDDEDHSSTNRNNGAFGRNDNRSKAKRNFGKSNHRQKKLGTRSYVLPDISQDTSPGIVLTGTRIP